MFDLTGDFSSLPEKGIHEVQVVFVEDKTSRSGGKYLNVKFSIIGGKNQGMGFFEMFNYQNKNDMAVNIAMAKLKNLVESSNVDEAKRKSFNPFSDLMGLNCLAELDRKTDDYGEKVVVKKFLSKKQSAATTPTDVPF